MSDQNHSRLSADFEVDLLPEPRVEAPASPHIGFAEATFLMSMIDRIVDLVRDVAPHSETSGRIKSQKAISAKARRDGSDVRKIHDKIGVRVVVGSTEECFEVIARLHAFMRHLPEAYDDYITHPKENGYQSLHTIVMDENDRLLEVQVRSRAMHDFAEHGPASHRVYKSLRESLPAPSLARNAEVRHGNVAFVGTYPPLNCAVGAHTAGLTQALERLHPEIEWRVVTMESPAHAYPEQVCYQIGRGSPESYREAAQFLNRSDATVLSVQHEFEIFDGPSGSFVLELMREVRMPIVTTLHTVTSHPLPGRKSVMDEVCALSTRLVVFSERIARLLADVHEVPPAKISVISRGEFGFVQDLSDAEVEAITGDAPMTIVDAFIDCLRIAYESYRPDMASSSATFAFGKND